MHCDLDRAGMVRALCVVLCVYGPGDYQVLMGICKNLVDVSGSALAADSAAEVLLFVLLHALLLCVWFTASWNFIKFHLKIIIKIRILGGFVNRRKVLFMSCIIAWHAYMCSLFHMACRPMILL